MCITRASRSPSRAHGWLRGSVIKMRIRVEVLGLEAKYKKNKLQSHEMEAQMEVAQWRIQGEKACFVRMIDDFVNHIFWELKAGG